MCVCVWSATIRRLLIHRNKERREAAILLQQAITSQRALQHAAWGARKDISAKLKALQLDTAIRGTAGMCVQDRVHRSLLNSALL